MVDLIFSLSEFILIVSYLFRNILFLRITTMIGLAGFIIGALLAGYLSPGMRALIAFNTLGLGVNLYQITLIVLEKTSIILPDDLKEIYKNNFQNISSFEFLKLHKLAKNKSAKKGDLLTRQNEPIEQLMLIQQGYAEVIKNGKVITMIGPGFFVGEMSFLTGELPIATVKVVDEPFAYIAWGKKQLNKLEKKQPALFIKLGQSITHNLIKKIHHLSNES